MNNSYHIKAFTILEIVISLAIMSIIIAIVYSIYVMMAEQLFGYSRTTDQINDYNQTHYMIKSDLFYSNQLLKLQDGLRLITSKDTVDYHLIDSKLVRATSKVVDTFSVPIQSFKLETEQEGITQKTKAVFVNYELLGVPIEAVYFKNYGISEDINTLFFANGN